jgi:AraC-like DNA-binding protein
MARPRKEIDEDLVFNLASLGCTMSEIAACCNCSRDLLQDRFAALIKEGHENRNCSLRRKQFEVAMNGNSALLIWLGKQYLGQAEKIEQSGEVSVKEAIDRGKRFLNGRANGHLVAPGNVSGDAGPVQ